MSFETICLECDNLKECKELEAQQLTEVLPLLVPLGWLLACPHGWREKVLAVEIRPLLEQGGPKPEPPQYLPRERREAQIAELLAEGPMQGRELARRIGLGPNTANAVLRGMHRQGLVEREQRGRYFWYELAA